MIDIRKIAQKATTFSELMAGRDKIDTADIIKYFGEKGITITAAEEVSIPDDRNEDGQSRFYVYIFDEAPDKFAFSGYILTKVFDDIMTECDGDINAFNEALATQKLPVKLSEGKTKNGKRAVTLVETI